MKTLWSLILALALCSIQFGVAATTITVDPGKVGTAKASYEFSFGDLNETPLEGQPISLSFVFDHMKHIQLMPLERTSYQAVLRFSTAAGTEPIVTEGGTAFLTDENGDPLFPASAVTTNGSQFAWAYFLQTAAENGLMHHDAHFDVALPIVEDGFIETGALELKLSPSNGDPLLVVGEWAPAVPEPASLLLLSLGLGTIALAMGIRAPLQSAPRGH